MDISEKEELSQLKKASTEAFEKLYFRYNAKLYNFVMKISNGDKYMAEELIQRTFIKIWETKDQINIEKSFISYLCTIAKNMLINEYQHQFVEFVYQDYVKTKMLEIDNITEKQIDKKMLEEYIDKLTEKLPPRRKEVFVLSRKEGFSNKEISEKLGISESTVETQLSKAIVFMKKMLQQHYGDVFIILTTLYIK